MPEATQNPENPPRGRTLADHPKRYTISPFFSAISNNLADRATSALFPWHRKNYPGIQRLRAWLMGVSRYSAAQYRFKGLPRITALTMAEKLEAKARELLALCEELRAYAATRPGRSGKSQARVSRSAVAPPPE